MPYLTGSMLCEKMVGIARPSPLSTVSLLPGRVRGIRGFARHEEQTGTNFANRRVECRSRTAESGSEETQA